MTRALDSSLVVVSERRKYVVAIKLKQTKSKSVVGSRVERMWRRHQLGPRSPKDKPDVNKASMFHDRVHLLCPEKDLAKLSLRSIVLGFESCYKN